MLALLRGPVGPAATQMSQLFAGLAAGATGKLAGLWSVAAAFFEAQAQGRLSADVYSKRLTSRLLAQVRLAERGQADVSDRLTQDLLFFCARALPGDDAKAPRLVAVRKAFGLGAQAPVDYEQEALGQYDPALIPLARRRVEALKESWSSATAGQSGLAASLREQATLVADSVRKLHPEGEHMARALDAAVTQVAEGCGRSVARPGDGSRHQPAVPGRRPRRRRHRRRLVRHPHPPARRAHRPGAPGPHARPDRAVDGRPLPPRLRSPDDGQRGAGTALVAGRRRRPARQVQPQPGRARAAGARAGQAVGHARRAVRAGPRPGRPRRRAHARRSRRRAGAIARRRRASTPRSARCPTRPWAASPPTSARSAS